MNQVMHQIEISIRLGTPMREIERIVIVEQLKKCRYNRTKTARVLGIGLRTLQRKLKEYQLELEQSSKFMVG